MLNVTQLTGLCGFQSASGGGSVTGPTTYIEEHSTGLTDTSATFTIPAGTLLVVGAHAQANASSNQTAAAITDSTGGGNWSEAVEHMGTYSYAPSQVVAYKHFATAQTNMTVTVTFTGGSVLGAKFLGVYGFTGHNSSTPIGATAEEAFEGSNTGSETAALTATTDANGVVLAFLAADCVNEGTVNAVDTGTGWTQEHENLNGDGLLTHVQSITGAQTQVTYDEIDTDFGYLIHAVEIQP